MCKRNVCYKIFALEKGYIDFAQNAHEKDGGARVMKNHSGDGTVYPPLLGEDESMGRPESDLKKNTFRARLKWYGGEPLRWYKRPPRACAKLHTEENFNVSPSKVRHLHNKSF